MTSMVARATIVLLCLAFFTDVAPVSCADVDDSYLFDVYSNESSAYIRSRLHGVTVRHVFKVSAVDRYFVVTPTNQQPALDDLDIPTASSVTRYSVDPACKFLATFDVKDCQPMNAVKVAFDVADLSYIEFEFKFLDDMDVAGMGQMLKEFGDTYKAALKDIKAEVYYGREPPRLYMFLNAGGDKVQQMVDSLVDKAGGPGNVLVNYQHLVEVLTTGYRPRP